MSGRNKLADIPGKPLPERQSNLLADLWDEATGAFARYGRRSGAQRDASLAMLNQAVDPNTDPLTGAGMKALGLAGLVTHPLAFFPTREEWDERLTNAGNDSRMSRSIGGFLSDLPNLIDPQMAAGGAALAAAPLLGKIAGKVDNAADTARLATKMDPELQKWFEGSQVVDDAGQPRVLYHGSKVEGLERLEPGRREPGVWFTPDIGYANGYAQGNAGQLYKANLFMKKPMVVTFDKDMNPTVNGKILTDSDGNPLDNNVDIIKYAERKSADYDGVHFPDGNFSEDGEAFVALYPDNIRLLKDSGRAAVMSEKPSLMPKISERLKSYLSDEVKYGKPTGVEKELASLDFSAPEDIDRLLSSGGSRPASEAVRALGEELGFKVSTTGASDTSFYMTFSRPIGEPGPYGTPEEYFTVRVSDHANTTKTRVEQPDINYAPGEATFAQLERMLRNARASNRDAVINDLDAPEMTFPLD